MDIPKSEVFPIEGFREFKIRLHNGSRMGIVDFVEWMKRNRKAD